MFRLHLHIQKLRNMTGVISEKDALNSIDLKVVFLFGGSLTLAKALDTTGAGELIADTVSYTHLTLPTILRV